MPQYILRDLPEGLWKRVKARAERDGWPLRALILQLLEDFAVERVTPGGTPPMPPRRVAVVHLSAGGEQRISGVVSADEQQAQLVLYGANAQLLARLPRNAIVSWALIDA